MARPISSTIGDVTPPGDLQRGFEFEELPQSLIEVADVTKGMVSSLPRTQIPEGAFLVAKNARVTLDGIRRRDGTTEFATKPDSNPVVGLVGIVNQSGDERLVRITPQGIHYSTEGTSFVAYTNNSPSTFNGAIIRPQTAPYLDDLYIVGFKDMLRITHASKSIDLVSEGPGNARYVTNFADRIIAAYIGEESYKIAWSGNADPLDWNGISAGEENLVQSPSDIGDAIAGIFGFERELVILRRQSIWIGQRQPFAAAPFRFFSDTSGIGCDLPYSAARVPGGIIFADRRTRAVYFYQLGRPPQRISFPIENDLFEGLESPYWVQGTFDAATFSYVLGITQTAGSRVMEKFWVYSLLKNSWSFDDGPDSQSLGVAVFSEGVMIDDLSGNIDDLGSVTIDMLNETTLVVRSHRGLSTGEVIFFDEAADTDFGSVAFELDLQSPNLGSISRRRTLADLMLTVDYSRAGSVVLEQSNDRTTWKNSKTITLSGDRVALRKTPITGEDLYWRLRATTSDVKVKAWWARVQEKGLQR